MRLFLALWPAPEAQTVIEENLIRLKERIDRQGVRFVRPEKIHLTLRFLGDDADPDLLTPRLERLVHAPFAVQTTGFGAFPSGARPKVVWLGLEGSGLESLHQEACRALEVPKEEPFVPHLTLARVNPGSKEVGRLLAGVEAETASWIVDRVTLVQTLPDGRYEIVGETALG